LLLLTGLYLLLYAVIVWHVGFVYEVLANVATRRLNDGIEDLYLEYLGQQKPLLFALVFTLPIFLYDLLKFSHRIAGPLFRCRRIMEEMASGKPVPEFKPRKNDLMQDLFQAFNAVIIEWNARISANGNGSLQKVETTEANPEGQTLSQDNNVTQEPEHLNV
jgi:hypothetical protein